MQRDLSFIIASNPSRESSRYAFNIYDIFIIFMIVLVWTSYDQFSLFQEKGIDYPLADLHLSQCHNFRLKLKKYHTESIKGNSFAFQRDVSCYFFTDEQVWLYLTDST